jgi:LAO/AO transport system kinase
MMKMNDNKPEWVPDNAGDCFATKVMEGVEGGHDGMSHTSTVTHIASPQNVRKQLTVEDYFNGIMNNDRTVIARAITLIESNAPRHFDQAQELLQRLLPYTGKSIRVGITGVPGAGKSTFIEALGMYLCRKGHRVAVLAVDPSSTVTKGSILGDKTRMENLSRMKNAFIRPSPSGGMLGGVARKSRETMLLCEAAGFDVLLVETVGVGQSEVTVRSMVDFFLLVLITGAGDELQGMKKGVIELCDAILVNKADGDNEVKALTAKADYNKILHYLQPATEGWTPQAYTCSALHNKGISEIWEVIRGFEGAAKASGVFEERRRNQTVDWVFTLVMEQLKSRFLNHQEVKELIPRIKKDLVEGVLSPTNAATLLLNIFDSKDC